MSMFCCMLAFETFLGWFGAGSTQHKMIEIGLDVVVALAFRQLVSLLPIRLVLNRTIKKQSLGLPGAILE